MKELKLGKRIINNYSKPYIIAEIGVNHEGSLNKAKALIKSAKDGGADAVKFQSYKADKLASINSPAYWDLNEESSVNQFSLFKKFDKFNQNDYKHLSKFCKDLNIDFASTPFDLESVDYLEELVSYYKISSSDITNLPLLKKIASKNKPVLLSTGASNLEEIKFARETISSFGSKEIVIMHCILNYPTSYKNANLNMIRDLKIRFPDNLIGYSDHTLPKKENNPLVIAWLLGAVVIEKHFTNNKSLKGNDHYHSMDENDLKKTVLSIESIAKLLGRKKSKTCIDSELLSRINARRSILLVNNLKKGHPLTEEDIISKRPGTGLSPIIWDEILGKRIRKDLKKDHFLSMDDLE